MTKPKRTANHIPLTKKYRVSYHLDQLEKRYGKSIVQQPDKYLEDFVPADDKDLIAIQKFREQANRVTRRTKYQEKPRAVIDDYYDQMMRWMTDGRSFMWMADRIGVAHNTLYSYIKRHHGLSVLYSATRSRRGGIPVSTVARIEYMFDRGLTYQEMANATGMSVDSISWQVRKIRHRRGEI